MNDGQYDEVNAVAALTEAQIRVAWSHDVRRSQLAAPTTAFIEDLCITSLAVNDGEVEQVFGPRRGVERYSDFEFLGEHPRKGPCMFDEQIFVALANHVSHAKKERGQQNEVQQHHAHGDVGRK